MAARRAASGLAWLCHRSRAGLAAERGSLGLASPGMLLVSEAAPHGRAGVASPRLAAQDTPIRAFAASSEIPPGLREVMPPWWLPQAIAKPEQAFVGQPAPEFTAPAVVDGEISQLSLSDYKGKYVILFFYPKDFTFVCPTEIIAFSDRAKEFADLNCQLIAGSTDTEEVHLAWIRTPRKKGGLGRMQIPIIADTTKEIAARYGILLKDAGVALRGLFIINPEGVIEQITINGPSVGRNVDEAKRLLQAIQFVAEHGEVCPADWNPGGPSMKPSADGSLDYFESADASKEEPFGEKLPSLKGKKDFDRLIAGDKPVVVDFYAPWCGKCRMIAPLVEKLMEENPGIAFAKVDTTEDALEPVASEQGVKVLPTFKFYRNGKEVHNPISGYKRKPLEDAVAGLQA